MENKFEIWGIVQLLGHNKIAGKLTEQNIAGANMLRVDVPETKKNPAFTRFFGSGAIYSIDPATEEFVVAYAEKLSVMPIEEWNIRDYFEKLKLRLPGKEDDVKSNDEDNDNELEF